MMPVEVMRVNEDLLPAHQAGEKYERMTSTDGTENLQSVTENLQSSTENLQSSPALRPGQGEDCFEVCKVCQCAEFDRKGEAALKFLGISPCSNGAGHTRKGGEGIADHVEYVSPDGEIFICSVDLEAGSYLYHQDALIELGCLCKNDLALAHYACALQCFISHGSIICEICGNLAENVRFADLNKVMAALKECETLRSRTAAGEVTLSYEQSHADVDADAIATVKRQWLIEIASWSNPQS